MLYFTKLFLISLFSYASTAGGDVVLPYKNNKILEFCKNAQNEFYGKNIFANPWYLFMLLFLGLFFFLIFLGMFKGLIGLCSRPIGELGLGLLVDLPKPLDKYREKSLEHLPVQYDVEGWPIHPYDNERTVRLLTKKTEFCLNVIFFLAYPLALCLHLGSLCFDNKPYSEDENGCFNCVSFIKMNERIKRSKEYYKRINTADVYEDDRKEEEDTRYVINQMHQSHISLQREV